MNRTELFPLVSVPWLKDNFAFPKVVDQMESRPNGESTKRRVDETTSRRNRQEAPCFFLRRRIEPGTS